MIEACSSAKLSLQRIQFSLTVLFSLIVEANTIMNACLYFTFSNFTFQSACNATCTRSWHNS